MTWTEPFPNEEITEKVTKKTVEFAERFGNYLGSNEMQGGRISVSKLTTNQLRKFFGEVKRQQMQGYDTTDFVLLKPKLAYAVGRTKQESKIKDFYNVLSKAIDLVDSEAKFKNFIKFFEAIVAYHKASETEGNKM